MEKAKITVSDYRKVLRSCRLAAQCRPELAYWKNVRQSVEAESRKWRGSFVMGKIPMRSAIAIRKEHKAVCSKMDDLTKEARAAGHRQGPLPKDEALYFRLFSIQQTLEWVYPSLIKTSGKGRERQMELAGHLHYWAGPLHAALCP